MANIMAFAGSNSSKSINFQLVTYTVELISGHDVQIKNMAHFPYPIYSIDTEKAEGFPESLLDLSKELKANEGLILSVNEHNGNPSAFFKNIIDWLSRIDRMYLEGIKVLLMSTSPGKRGGIGSLSVIEKLLPRFGAEVIGTFSLPSYFDNFKPGEGILDKELRQEHRSVLDAFLEEFQ